MQKMEEKISIRINNDDYAIFKRRAKEKGFESVEKYLEDILVQISRKLKWQEESTKSASQEEDEERVKKRLAELGYLD